MTPDRCGASATAGLTLLSANPPHAIVSATAYASGQRLVADRQGRLWIGTRGDGLVRVSRGNGVAVDQVARPGVSSYDVVLAVFEDREGNIWVGTPRGLDRGSRGLIDSQPGPGGGITAPVQAVAAASDGSVWVGTTERTASVRQKCSRCSRRLVDRAGAARRGAPR